MKGKQVTVSAKIPKKLKDELEVMECECQMLSGEDWRIS